jgi:hydrogenase expression/formation protein HypE
MSAGAHRARPRRGGRLTAQLFQQIFLPAFDDPILRRQEDQAELALTPGRGAVTTDAFVVSPLFFPGGDIGSLAVHGSLNDLAVGGAEPRYLTAAFVLEEGLALAALRRIARSMGDACRRDGVELVAGDTKVVERGKGDGVFITTTAVGVVTAPGLSVSACRPGDHVLVSGALGDHGVAILSLREGLEFGTELRSDTASLLGLTRAMLACGPGIRCMRDPTRGGLASTLNEIAAASHAGIRVDESEVPIRPAVRGACEMLGLGPLYVTNEGKLVAVVAPEASERVLAAMRAHPPGTSAARIGEVVAAHPKVVTVRTAIGGERMLAMLSGEQLPRIC